MLRVNLYGSFLDDALSGGRGASVDLYLSLSLESSC